MIRANMKLSEAIKTEEKAYYHMAVAIYTQVHSKVSYL